MFGTRKTQREFQPGDMVLMWNSKAQDKGKYEKFHVLWLGMYEGVEKHGQDSCILHDANEDSLELPMHGKFLEKLFS